MENKCCNNGPVFSASHAPGKRCVIGQKLVRALWGLMCLSVGESMYENMYPNRDCKQPGMKSAVFYRKKPKVIVAKKDETKRRNRVLLGGEAYRRSERGGRKGIKKPE